jgi:hypothetical protein
LKLREIKKAEKDIHDFCQIFGSVITITNAKGIWTGKMTRRTVMTFLATGSSMLELNLNIAEKCNLKRKQLGK